MNARLIFALILIFLSVGGSFLAVRMGISGTIVRYNPRTEPLETAARLTPDDPIVQCLLGQSYLYDPDHINPVAARKALQTSVEIAPKDHRFWMALAKSFELEGNLTQAESCCERAVILAPHYYEPRWQWANLLVRTGKVELAAAQFRKTLEINPTQTLYTLDLLWQASDGDWKIVQLAVPEVDSARCELVQFLVRKGLFSEGVSQWLALVPPVRVRSANIGRWMVEQLVAAQHFDLAWNVWRTLPEHSGRTLIQGQVSNGDFNLPITGNETDLDWKFFNSAQAQLSLDDTGPAPHLKSVRIHYEATGSPTFDHLRQIILVTPGKTYRLRYSARSEELVSGSLPQVDLLDTAAASPPLASLDLPSRTQAWRPYEVVFTAGPETHAVVLLVHRLAKCRSDEPCPIFGSIWVTSFSIEPLER